MAVEVDGAGPIGRTRTGIGFLPRTGYEWTYLKRAPNQSQSPSRERLPPSVTSGFEGLRYARYARAQTKMSFWSLCPLVWGGGFAPRWGWGPHALRPGWAQGAAHCAPVGGGAKPTAPRLGVGVIFLIPSGGSYQNFCPSYCRVPRVPGVPGSPVAGLALNPEAHKKST